MKRAFTLSEALITLAIIGVLASILIPVINNVKPDKDKVTYKKALYDMQAAVSNAMDASAYNASSQSAAMWADKKSVSESDFCEAVADSLNTSGKVDCSPAQASTYNNPNFITTDGTRFWGLEGQKFSLGENGEEKKLVRDVCIDRKMNQKELAKAAIIRNKTASNDDCGTGMKIRVRYDGKVLTPESTDEKNGNFNYENDMIEEFLSISKQK